MKATKLVEAFLAPPLFSTDHARGFGTIYTATYRPLEGSMTLHWPNQAPWQQSFREFSEGRRRVRYDGLATAGTAEARRSWREWIVEGLSAEQRRYLPAGFAKALLQGIGGDTADDWRPFTQLWATGGRGLFS